MEMMDKRQKLALDNQFQGEAVKLLPYFYSPDITDILINGTSRAFVEELGDLKEIDNPFTSKESLWLFIEKLLLPLGKQLKSSCPCEDGRLMDGSRFHIIGPPIAENGPYISIRKNRFHRKITLQHFGSRHLIHWMLSLLKEKKNLLICGPTGSGKTSLLSLLVEHIGVDERIIIIEESREIYVRNPNAVFLEARSGNLEGKGEVSLETLIKQSLRMRPDRLILGECRSKEAFELILALNTGHGGSLSTIHANGCLDALSRLESLLLLSTFVSCEVARRWVSSAIHGVVYLEREKGGHRAIQEAFEIKGLEGTTYRFLPILKK